MASLSKATPGSSARTRARRRGRGSGIVALFSATLLSERRAHLPRPAHVREVRAAAVRQHAGRLEHLDAVLPDDAPRRLPLRAREHAAPRGAPAGRAAHRCPARAVARASGRRSRRLDPSGDSNPVPWLLGLLAVAVGLPFFVVSTTAPLLQRWLAATDHPRGCGSLLPVPREQHRQRARPARISAARRAVDAPRRAGKPVVVGLWAARPAGARVRGRGVALAAAPGGRRGGGHRRFRGWARGGP